MENFRLTQKQREQYKESPTPTPSFISHQYVTNFISPIPSILTCSIDMYNFTHKCVSMYLKK